MKLRINLPDTLTAEKIDQLIAKIRNILISEGGNLEIETNLKDNDDPWDNLDFDTLAV